MSKIIKRNIAETCEEYIKIFGGNKNLYRVIPSMIDGLKPVARRILYSMYEGGYSPKKEREKVSRLIGDTMHYHPHGDASIQDTLIAMAQSFNNNAPTIDPKGNFGTLAGDEPAAPRYINARISEYGWKCFFEDFKNSVVDMKLAYTGKDEEPEFLPARYPHALLNGTLGIGYGLASNIPPYNLKEVFEATIKLIKNPDADIVLVPDSPTGSIIVDDGNFNEISNTGVGTYRMRASIIVDEIKNILTIVDVPYQTTLDKFIKGVINLKKSFDEITDIKNESNKDTGIVCKIFLKHDVNPYDFMEKLYKKTTLEQSYPINIKLIDDYQDYDYSIKSFLLDWIEYRRDIKRSSFNLMLVKRMEENHINDIMLFILNSDNAEHTMKIIKKSKDKSDIISRLMNKYNITSLQARTIANMSLSSFTKSAYDSYKQKKKDLKEEIAHLENLIDNTDSVDRIIIEELEDGIKRFGVPRKSPIINLSKKKSIPNTNHIVAISQDGYCKKLDIDNGNVGRVGKNNEQFIAMSINNRDSLLIFDNIGNVCHIDISSIPNVDVDDVGVSLDRYSHISNKIVSMIKEPTNIKSMKDVYIIFITKKGYIKKTSFTEFDNIKTYKSSITLEQGDELVNVLISNIDDNDKDIIVYTENGNGIRININDIKKYGRTARGLRYITLNDGDNVISADMIHSDRKYLLYITSQGKLKLTDNKYFPTMKRKDETLSLISLDNNDKLVGVKGVNKKMSVQIFKKYSDPELIDIADIEVSSRASKAKKMVKIPKGDFVVAYKIIIH